VGTGLQGIWGQRIVGKYHTVTGDPTGGKASSYARFLEGDFGGV